MLNRKDVAATRVSARNGLMAIPMLYVTKDTAWVFAEANPKAARPWSPTIVIRITGRRRWSTHILEPMRRTMAIGFAFLMIYWAAAPLLACAASQGPVNGPKHGCCAPAALTWSSAGMPQSRSCCQAEATPAGTMVVTSEQQSVPALEVVASLPPAVERSSWRPRSGEQQRPPGEFLSDISVLRI